MTGADLYMKQDVRGKNADIKIKYTWDYDNTVTALTTAFTVITKCPAIVIPAAPLTATYPMAFTLAANPTTDVFTGADYAVKPTAQSGADACPFTYYL